MEEKSNKKGRAFRPDELQSGCMVAVTGIGDMRHVNIRDLTTGLEITNVVAFRLSADKREHPNGPMRIELVLSENEDCTVAGEAASIAATAKIAIPAELPAQ